MSKLVSDLSKKLKLNNKKPKIIYPEGDHFFIQQVAKKISKHIKPILVFKKKIDIPKNFPFKTIAIDSIDLSKYANFLYELRKNKGMTFKQAKIMVKKPNYLCPLLVKLKEVDGEICGINYSTKDTIKPALQIIKPKKNAKFVTSIFLFEKQNEQFLFADCAIMVNPQANELANIAIMACEFAKNVLQIQKPKCAFLSYSTYGSGSGELVDKVVQACKIAKKLDKNNEYDLVGEIQFDAAYNKEIWLKKVKSNSSFSQPNIFIFPDINSGNIGYKIAQQLGKYHCYGPILLGLDKPANDLSRGATIPDIIGTSYLTAMQIIQDKKSKSK